MYLNCLYFIGDLCEGAPVFPVFVSVLQGGMLSELNILLHIEKYVEKYFSFVHSSIDKQTPLCFYIVQSHLISIDTIR